ncbi:alpha-(1,3)-fucosyltransferase C-like [Centruroides vittatus]|uniref:alpha-(1,3)-fucosyltransferase C-like n=1 Tax=Centruroides vittatus TaxID=120091 RepID=UPI00350FA9E9
MKFAKRFLVFAAAGLCCLALVYRYFLTGVTLPSGPLRPREEASAEERRPGDPRLILLWTTFFGRADYVPPLDTLDCPRSDCLVTSNRSRFRQSDAVVFHLRDTSPDDLPPARLSRQKWILLHHESPPHTPNVLSSLDGLIDWTATYREDSDVYLSPRPVQRAEDWEGAEGDRAANKTRMAAWFVSNCNTPGRREDFVRELRKTLSVDVYGACGQKSCLPKMSRECLRKASSEYRFYLSFENSICKDYVTEKFFDVLETDMVPVVLGGADYSRIAPPHSYVDALAFESPRHLGRFLIGLAKDPRRYNRYFDWKKKYRMDNRHYVCQICQKLHAPDAPSTTYGDLNKWWFGDANCRSWAPS